MLNIVAENKLSLCIKTLTVFPLMKGLSAKTDMIEYTSSIYGKGSLLPKQFFFSPVHTEMSRVAAPKLCHIFYAHT